MNGFGVKAPAKRPAMGHAGQANNSGSLAFIRAHRNGKADVDVQPTKGPLPGTWFADKPCTYWGEHWSTPRRCGYRRIKIPGTQRTRALTKAELNRPSVKWTSEAWSRLRTGPSVHSGRSHTLDELVAEGRRVDCQVIPEPKRPAFVARPRMALVFVGVFKRYDMACWPKVLCDGRPGVRAMCNALGKLGIRSSLIGGKRAQAKARAMYRQSRSRLAGRLWRPIKPNRW